MEFQYSDDLFGLLVLLEMGQYILEAEVLLHEVLFDGIYLLQEGEQLGQTLRLVERYVPEQRHYLEDIGRKVLAFLVNRPEYGLLFDSHVDKVVAQDRPQ